MMLIVDILNRLGISHWIYFKQANKKNKKTKALVKNKKIKTD